MKFLIKIRAFFKRTKWWWRGAFALFFMWYIFCLPKVFFNDPTCTVVKDREGQILAARIADDGQWRFPHNERVPEKFKKAIVQFEDRRFYSHWGVSLRAIFRAMKQNFSAGEVVSGGSTITMQVIRMMRKQKSRGIFAKLVEAIMATRLEWRLNKDEILAYYASNAPMGGNVVGLDAAAWRYFGRTPDQLTWAESATLAVLPNAPSLIFPGKNHKKLLAKRNRLLKGLYDKGEMDKMTYELALSEKLPNKPPHLPMLAKHLTEKLIQQKNKGQNIVTTIDKNIQQKVKNIVDMHNKRLSMTGIHNAAVLVIDTKTGEVLSYIGNSDDDISGEHGCDVDVVQAPRSSGSILKPFLYAAMIEERSITPDQLVADVPLHLTGYAPKNFSQNYDGAVPASTALARSLNIPAVRMLQQYGIVKFHRLLKRDGLHTLSKPASHYGLSLVLGGAEATAYDLGKMYYDMAQPLLKREMYPEVHYIKNEKPGKRKPVFSPATSWVTLKALLSVTRPEGSGNWWTFASSQKVAWKTGTSFGFRDAWSVGVTPNYVVAVWVGNSDGEGRPGLIGIQAAAPLMFDVFNALPKSTWFAKPTKGFDYYEVCNQSGYRANDLCPDHTRKLLPATAENVGVCPYHVSVQLDKTKKFRVTSECYDPSDMVEETWFVLTPLIEHYYKKKYPFYRELPPYMQGCAGDKPEESMAIVYPKKPSKIFIPVGLDGTREKVIFELTHRNHNAIVYWHLDDEFIGSTQDIHQMELCPTAGKHKLTVMDENGEKITQTFEVLDKVE
jgi:penicillin-binding protein 1C